MTSSLDIILTHLEALVEVDTQNPPRTATGEGLLVRTLRSLLPGFQVEVTDLGQGCVIIDAVRGAPKILFNVHLDTVPVQEGWSVPPHALTRTEDRAIGLGACDIKGAAAVLITLAAEADAPMRLVFTTDEEAGQSVCIRHFVRAVTGLEAAVIAEPTNAQPVLEHRGILSSAVLFEGVSAHASNGGHSAVHEAAGWVHAVTQHPLAKEVRLNVGRIEGGMKPNMIAARCEALYGFRSPPGVNAEEIDSVFRALAPSAVFKRRFLGPALPCGTEASEGAQSKARTFLDAHDLKAAEPVDFWTEASLFAEAGVAAVVLGPGDIAQAHTADEWVSFDSLLATLDRYRKLIHAL